MCLIYLNKNTKSKKSKKYCRKCGNEGWTTLDSNDYGDPYFKHTWGYCTCLAGWEKKCVDIVDKIGACEHHPMYIPNIPPTRCQWCEMLWAKAPRQEQWQK